MEAIKLLDHKSSLPPLGWAKGKSRCTEQEPLSLIFLDIDGVMINHKLSSALFEDLHTVEKAQKVWISSLQMKNIVSNYFSEDSVKNLKQLIETTRKTSRVAIVLSSHWRNNASVDDIRHRMFSNSDFPKLIIDKTPDLDRVRKSFDKEPISPVARKKYGFSLEDKDGSEIRGREIEYWLLENKGKLNIKSFVILDDYDNELSHRFPNNFVKVENLLSKTDVEKACQILNKTSFSSTNLFSQNTWKRRLRLGLQKCFSPLASRA